ncbi:DUF4280 domain-containing protein [Flavobacterium sp. 3-218]
MSEKHKVVQGAVCRCILSVQPDTDILKVKSQSKHFGNDKEGKKKLYASTKDIGQTFEKNTFGKCTKQPIGADFLPCVIQITEWKNFYDKITLSNGGKIILEDSKATCLMGTPDSIEIVNHGQISEPIAQNFQQANPDIQNRINPLLNLGEIGKPDLDCNGIEHC